MTKQIISTVSGNLGHITLNRPKALNALTQPMVDEITRLMLAWEKDMSIGAVLIDGAGERAFCAGGDVILLHDSGKAGDARAENFWRTEYALNDLIHRYSKPYITLIDGFVMGGGVGLSVHGGLRIAGDETVFAMPETGIGYFPDVGGSYFLPRLGMAVGQWLGLTGARLSAGQCIELGIATGYVPSAKHDALIKALGRAWAVKQASNLRRKSPLALSVTQEALRRGGDLSFRDAMTQELDISLNFLKTQDFYEGIRAQLIDKDRNPKWSHDGVSAVTQSQIERLFTKTANPPQAFLD